MRRLPQPVNDMPTMFTRASMCGEQAASRHGLLGQPKPWMLTMSKEEDWSMWRKATRSGQQTDTWKCDQLRPNMRWFALSERQQEPERTCQLGIGTHGRNAQLDEQRRLLFIPIGEHTAPRVTGFRQKWTRLVQVESMPATRIRRTCEAHISLS